MKKRTELHFDIAEEIKMSRNQKSVDNAEFYKLYSAIVECWDIEKRGRNIFTDTVFYNLGRAHGIREERARRKKKKARSEAANKEICRLGAEMVQELSKATPEDYLQAKIMMMSVVREPGAENFLRRVFALAEERRPLLLEMSGIAPAQQKNSPEEVEHEHKDKGIIPE